MLTEAFLVENDISLIAQNVHLGTGEVTSFGVLLQMSYKNYITQQYFQR